MATPRSATAPASKRRPTAEIRELLLEAGREEFAARGFGGATTREIAERAGVAEVLIFRHFGSKAGLFVQSVLRPLHGFVEEEVSRVTTDPSASIEQLMRGFIGHLYDLLAANRELFLALVAVAEFDPEVLADAADTDVGDLWEVLEQITAAVRADRGQPPVDAVATTRATIGMVMAMVLLDGFLFPPGTQPSRERAVDAMTWLVVNGVRAGSNRPGDHQ